MELALKNLATWVARCLVAMAAWAVADGVAGDDRGARQAGRERPPNIIFFIVDDLGWQDTSIAFGDRPTEFQKHFRTPNLERLAKNGIRFSNAHACTVCTPTRVSILTGQNAARHRVTNWILRVDQETSGKTERLAVPRDWHRAGTEAVVTLPKILRRQGYTTIHCGKAHWGAVGTSASDPKNLGFDVNIAGHAAGAPGSYQGMKNFGNAAKAGPPTGEQAHENREGQTPIAPQASQLASDPARGKIEPVPENVWAVPGLEKYHGTEMHLTDALAEEAAAELDRVPRDQPFFLHFAPYAVHTPIEPHERFMADYVGRNYTGTDRQIPLVEAQYASMVAGVDAALGAILSKLQEQGRAAETLVVFTSDNGGLSAHARGLTPRGTGRDTHNWPLREGKGSAYGGGTRVPLLVAWAKPDPGNALQRAIPIGAGMVCAAPVICEDLFATLCAWAGVGDELIAKCAAEYGLDRPVVDGKDFTPLLSSQASESQSSFTARRLLFHYPHVWGPTGPGYQPHSALIVGDWKVIYFCEPRRWELYDLSRDIGEASDLAAEQAGDRRIEREGHQTVPPSSGLRPPSPPAELREKGRSGASDLAHGQPAKLAEMAEALIAELRDKGALYPDDRNTGAPEPPMPPR